MPHAISIEEQPPGVVITLTGLIHGSEIHALNEELMATEAFARWRYQIWDFSQIEGIDINADQIRDFAMQDARAIKLNPDQRVAIIPRPSPNSGLDRVFHIMEGVWGGYPSKTCFNLEAARAWASQPKA
jgi:hypothetical protein